MKLQKLVLLFIVFGLLSFQPTGNKVFEFKYPKSKTAAITLSADQFKKFTKEWRGSDYYYYAESDGFICSVLFYKLNEEEKPALVDAPKIALGGTDNSPAYPFSYFKNYSNLKSMETNDSSWGSATDDFMFRQNDVTIAGTNFSQKHMYGYCMFDNDLFVNIHLSKTGCTPSDSTVLIEILKSLAKKK